MKNHIILYRSNNSPGKRDATGAFEPEARALRRLLLERYATDRVALRGVNLVRTRMIINKAEKRAWQRQAARNAFKLCLRELDAQYKQFRSAELEADPPVVLDPESDPNQIHSLSYFCHGWRSRPEFEDAGIHGAHDLAELLVVQRVELLNLFCCSTATPHDSGNFAQWVATACAERRHAIQVLGHETSGHTSWNARLAVYWSYPSEKPENGYLVVHQAAVSSGEHQLLETAEDFERFAAHMKADQNYRLLLPYLLDE